MTTITDKGMQAKASSEDKWLSQPFMRGGGVFMGRITPAGERMFYFRYTDSKGKRPFLPIGAFHPKGDGGGLTIAAAYDKASALSALYRSGMKDLREHFEQQAADAKQADEDARHAAEAARIEAAESERSAGLERERRLTVRQLFERWAATDLTPHTGADGKRTGRKDGGKYSREQFERRIFPKLGDVAAVDVRKGDVMSILDAVKAEGKLRTCNVLLADMKQMLRFAVLRDLILHSPLETITKRNAGGAETKRKRALSVDELGTLASLLPEARLSARSELAVWLILSTACRISEAMGALWQHVDLVARTWHLPTTKNEREHTIHLSAFAVRQFEALAALRELGEDGKPMPWVFPNTAAKGPVCIKSFGKQLADRQRAPSQRMQHRSKATNSLMLPGGKWTAHDLRRTASTRMSQLGIPEYVIEECLNHTKPGMSGVYNQDLRLLERARAFDALGAKLDSIVSGIAHPSNVVTLADARSAA